MNQNQLVSEVSDKAGVSKAAVSDVLAALREVIQGAIKSGDEVTLVGVGKFSRRMAAARTVKSPTGGVVEVPATMRPKFSASVQLKRAAEGV